MTSKRPLQSWTLCFGRWILKDIFVVFPWGSFVSYPSVLSLSSFSLFSIFLWQITVSKFDSLLPYNLKDRGTGSILLATIYDSFPSRDLPCGSFDPLPSVLLPILAVPQDLGRKKQICRYANLKIKTELMKSLLYLPLPVTESCSSWDGKRALVVLSKADQISPLLLLSFWTQNNTKHHTKQTG